jgi:glucosamine--fructose-6-phosphate aminotransferase (isomerizing)
MARIPCETDVASEFPTAIRSSMKTLLMLWSANRGRTADTLASMREAKQRGGTILAVVNVPLDDCPRGGQCHFHLCRSGNRRRLDQAFTAQLVALYLLAAQLGRVTAG